MSLPDSYELFDKVHSVEASLAFSSTELFVDASHTTSNPISSRQKMRIGKETSLVLERRNTSMASMQHFTQQLLQQLLTEGFFRIKR